MFFQVVLNYQYTVLSTMAKFCANLLAGACAAVAAFSDGCLCNNETPLVKLKNSLSQLWKFLCFAGDDDTVSVEANPKAERLNNKSVRFAPTFRGQIVNKVHQTNSVVSAATDDLNNAAKVATFQSKVGHQVPDFQGGSGPQVPNYQAAKVQKVPTYQASLVQQDIDRGFTAHLENK